MPKPTRAILLEVQTFFADNNLRRNVAGFSANYGSTSDSVAMQSFTLEPGAFKLLESPVPRNVVTLLRTTSPLTAQLTVGASTLEMTISKMFVIDAEISAIRLTNPSNKDAAKVSFQQG